jgi:hypothetical protein
VPNGFFYRLALVEGVLLLAAIVLAFATVTILARRFLSELTATESLTVRLGSALLLGSIAAFGPSSFTVHLLEATGFVDSAAQVDSARAQALVGLLLAIAIAVVAVVRIEVYYRRLGQPLVDEEWNASE